MNKYYALCSIISYVLLQLSPEKLSTILYSFSDKDSAVFVINNSPQMYERPHRLLYSCLFITVVTCLYFAFSCTL
jgi:hypothetical protein